MNFADDPREDEQDDSPPPTFRNFRWACAACGRCGNYGVRVFDDQAKGERARLNIARMSHERMSPECQNLWPNLAIAQVSQESELSPTDSEMLRFLTEKDCGVISDDAGRFAVPSAGFQNVPDHDTPTEITSTFVVAADEWCPTIRAAIWKAMKEDGA